MSKQKMIWSCGSCGHHQTKWVGQCPQCQEWNTLHEECDFVHTQRFEGVKTAPTKPQRIDEVALEHAPRVATGMGELDRLLGGGVVPGSVTLIGGDPGIGKSTLMLQAAHALAQTGRVVLYVCGEESTAQTSLRARRLGVCQGTLYLFSETDLHAIRHQVDSLKPDILIIDSIQVIHKKEIPSAPGSVAQVRETASELVHLAKARGLAVFLVGHVTKSGEIAGPRVLEHLVDTVLYFEGDRQHHYRMLRSIKNRFGSTDELAVFQMQEGGLIEITNPSQIFLEERMRGNPGSVIAPTVEGSRPILIEIQALVTDTGFSTPSRRCAGLDTNRLALLLAVLEKKVGYQLHMRDVFVSVAGGLKITEPSIDLGVAMAVASSLTGRILDPEMVVLGEVGLGGEIRRVPRLEARLREAAHMGFKKALVPKRNVKETTHQGIQLVGVERVEEAIAYALS